MILHNNSHFKPIYEVFDTLKRTGQISTKEYAYLNSRFGAAISNVPNMKNSSHISGTALFFFIHIKREKET